MSSIEPSSNSLNALLHQVGASVQRAKDGSILWWGGDHAPAPTAVVSPGVPTSVTVGVSPVRPGQALTVEYRVNGGPIHQAVGLPELRAHDVSARLFRAVLPGQAGGVVEFLPVLRFAGQPISPRLSEAAECARYQVGSSVARITTDPSGPADSVLADQPRWDWGTKFLGSLTATVQKEVVGITPDGLRIDWRVQEGSFVGPGLNAVVLPGATDWMRIRRDGVAIVNVQACFETQKKSRIYGSYGGIFDLGPDGYTRAVRDEFAPLPPVVVTPTYATADKQLEWLNRAQCIGVGRVDMKALRVEFDVYVVRVGGRKK